VSFFGNITRTGFVAVLALALVCLYTPAEASAISFTSEGAVLVDVEKYDLEIEQA